MNHAAVFELEIINAFVTVADCSSFTIAARQLNLTQSTISQQIKRLEDRIGKTLFRRSTRSVALTEDGVMLLDYARSMLKLAQDAHLRLLTDSRPGHLSVAASDDLAYYWLPPVLRRYHQCSKNVRLEIHVGITDELLKGAESGGYDVVLAKSLDENSTDKIIGGDQLVWAGDPGLISDSDKPVPLALFPDGCVYRRAALNTLNNVGRKWEVIVTSPSLNAIHTAVESGIAIAPLAQCFATGLRAENSINLPALPVVWFILNVAPSAVRKPEVIRFLDLLDKS